MQVINDNKKNPTHRLHLWFDEGMAAEPRQGVTLSNNIGPAAGVVAARGRGRRGGLGEPPSSREWSARRTAPPVSAGGPRVASAARLQRRLKAGGGRASAIMEEEEASEGSQRRGHSARTHGVSDRM